MSTEEALNQIKFEIVDLIKKSTCTNWISAVIKFDFPPFINKGLVGSQIAKDDVGNNVRLIRFSEALNEKVYNFISRFNQNYEYNQIVLTALKDKLDEAVIQVLFNKEVDDAFQKNLPSTYKDNYTPWWKNPAETKDLLSNIEALPAQDNYDDSVTTSSANLLVLPKPGVRMDTTGLTLDKAFFELNKAVVYKEEDPLWDGGYYLIKHDKEGWSGNAMMYLYDSQESKDKHWRPDEVDCTLTITEEIKKLFLYIQEHYSKTNPGVPFDTLGVEVSPDGSRYTANFELDDIDVFPDAPPKPEKITAAYLSENLKNCLAYNAPDSYKWLWEILTKTQTEDGETQLEGKFYYSLHEDKSDPQPLEPGEYIFMYHVSERLFDEFLTDTRGWSQIVAHFHVNGKVTYQVLKL